MRAFPSPTPALQFAGGHQLAGPEGLAGAAAAAAVVGTLQGDQAAGRGWYEGSMGPGGALVEPVFWFVDMQAPFEVGGWLAGMAWPGPLVAG